MPCERWKQSSQSDSGPPRGPQLSLHSTAVFLFLIDPQQDHADLCGFSSLNPSLGGEVKGVKSCVKPGLEVQGGALHPHSAGACLSRGCFLPCDFLQSPTHTNDDSTNCFVWAKIHPVPPDMTAAYQPHLPTNTFRSSNFQNWTGTLIAFQISKDYISWLPFLGSDSPEHSLSPLLSFSRPPGENLEQRPFRCLNDA